MRIAPFLYFYFEKGDEEMSELWVTQKIYFPNQKAAKKFYKILDRSSSEKTVQETLRVFCKKLLDDIDEEILEEEPWNIEPLLDEEKAIVFIEYSGSDDDVFDAFCEACIKQGASIVFSLYAEDHTGEYIFNIDDASGRRSFEQGADFEIDSKDYQDANDLEVLSYLESLFRSGTFDSSASESSSGFEQKFEDGDLEPAWNIIHSDNPDLCTDTHTYVYTKEAKAISSEVISDYLGKNGWHEILCLKSGKISKSKDFPHYVVASKEPIKNLSKIVKDWWGEEFLQLRKTNKIGVISPQAYEKFNVKEFLIFEQGDEVGEQIYNEIPEKPQKLLKQMRCQYTLHPYENELSIAATLQLYFLIGSLMPSIEYDWEKKKYCVIKSQS
jgi:hypothetical protein